LGARWFISGHAPWSNAYEAIVYVWATMFFGLAFDIKSKLTVASICIGYYFICSLHELIDPEIANLQPFLTLTG
jgi:ABC-type transport system involved in cytochrome c biogenesis permease subunit